MYGAFGSVATAGSQSSQVELITCDPTQPVAGLVVAAIFRPKSPLALASASASRRLSVTSASSWASAAPPRPSSPSTSNSPSGSALSPV